MPAPALPRAQQGRLATPAAATSRATPESVQAIAARATWDARRACAEGAVVHLPRALRRAPRTRRAARTPTARQATARRGSVSSLAIPARKVLRARETRSARRACALAGRARRAGAAVRWGARGVRQDCGDASSRKRACGISEPRNPARRLRGRRGCWSLPRSLRVLATAKHRLEPRREVSLPLFVPRL